MKGSTETTSTALRHPLEEKLKWSYWGVVAPSPATEPEAFSGMHSHALVGSARGKTDLRVGMLMRVTRRECGLC